ncbi:hypothetical protein COL154_007790 [Colletotrichum chrysophilum]|uniref:uncharacterized protein n=1 Tax=Colletotrichum chrysophilum TaxID=1836956 RepID=UPI00230194A3|nr:uncharacterized protein COL26b_010219 [Colletotrichum chrysophilum]KAJ0345364.1 hypothetical protein KNSL1_008453 [Colletotrichum chrysophilum]KAJ0360044.1 hypothetical protein COL154_007790 [Colletotrichum chrysophilum]KAJ0370015.1 hypothetical protein COL26b_010219 [Colletotrichum chrysophilum]
MARLTGLPSELIEMICDYIRPMQPMRDRFAKTTHENNPIDRVLLLEWRSLRDLSVTSRYFRNVIMHGGLLHRTLIIRDSFHELFNLLKLFKSDPELALAVKQLYIRISRYDPGPQDFGPHYTLPILTAIKDLGMDSEAARREVLPRSREASPVGLRAISPFSLPATLENEPDWQVSVRRYGVLVKLVLAQMTNLEDLGADIMSADVLKPQNKEYGRAHREFINVRNLSQLRSVSLRGSKESGLVSSDLDFLLRLGPVKHLYIDTMNAGSRTAEWVYNLFFTLVGVLDNVTTLILSNSTFLPLGLKFVLRHCAPLSTFKYSFTNGQISSLSLPSEVVAVLGAWHGKTLRTLCLRFLPVGGNNYVARSSTSNSLIKSLQGFDVLESLWVDLDAVAGGTERRPAASQPANSHTLPWIIGTPERFVASLPRTLKRVFLCVPYRTNGWDDSVVWLARAADEFPGLNDILYYTALRGYTFRMISRRPVRCPYVPVLQWD